MYSGALSKMVVKYNNPVDYYLVIDNEKILLNKILNKQFSLRWLGKVKCICNKFFSKFYRQSFCYQCFWNAPQASQSIFKPELCTADLGVEERDLEWEKQFQICSHYVYLANSSNLKVGITRKGQHITRWIDQGASQAIKIAEVPNRRLSGLIEVAIKKHIADRTNWRKMLSGLSNSIDLVFEKERIRKFFPKELVKYFINTNTIYDINYPVVSYPNKVSSLKMEKENLITGKLVGIKGQYLIFENNTVFNVRAHQGFVVEFST